MPDKQLVTRIGYIMTNNPWRVLLVTLLFILILSIGLKSLGFKNDYRVYFSKENPQLIAFEAIQDTYNKSDNILFVIDPTEGDVFSPPVLQAIQLLTKEAWQLPYSSRVDSITNFQHTVAHCF